MGDRYACRHTAGLHKLVTCFYLSGVVISKKVFLFLVKKRSDLSLVTFTAPIVCYA